MKQVHPENLQVLGATVQNLVSVAARCLRFKRPWAV